MARGKDLHDAHQAAVASLGRGLSRRARSRCELCGESGSLHVLEVPPTGEEPSEDAAILACARCHPLLTDKRLRADELRFLETAVWSEILPVQVLAVTLLRRLAAGEVVWARDTLDGLWLSDEVAERVGDA